MFILLDIMLTYIFSCSLQFDYANIVYTLVGKYMHMFMNIKNMKVINHGIFANVWKSANWKIKNYCILVAIS